jgi:hypothetical protein
MRYLTPPVIRQRVFPKLAGRHIESNGRKLTMGLILLIVLILLLFGGLPNWGYHSYGYAPSGIVGTILIIVLILFLLGRI